MKLTYPDRLLRRFERKNLRGRDSPVRSCLSGEVHLSDLPHDPRPARGGGGRPARGGGALFRNCSPPIYIGGEQFLPRQFRRQWILPTGGPVRDTLKQDLIHTYIYI
jgi:hypothetical protein